MRGNGGAAQLFQVALLRKHLPQIIDVGGGFVVGQVRTGDFFRFLEATPQADDQRQVLAYFRSGVLPSVCILLSS